MNGHLETIKDFLTKEDDSYQPKDDVVMLFDDYRVVSIDAELDGEDQYIHYVVGMEHLSCVEVNAETISQIEVYKRVK